MSKEIVKVVENVDNGIQSLEQLQQELSNMATPELTSGYVVAKDFSNRAKKFTEAVRSEILERKNTGEEDGKGNKYLYGDEGEELKLEKRVQTTLDEDKAKMVLGEKGLYNDATKPYLEGNQEDAEKLLRIWSELEPVLIENNGVPVQTIDTMRKLLDRVIKREVNQEKVEALLALELLDTDDVEAMFNTKVTYALKSTGKRKES